jgi:hypothetical protein
MGARIGQMASQFPQQNEQIGKSLAEGRAAQIRAAVTGTAAAGRPMARGTLGQAAAQSIQQQAQPQLQARQQTLQQQGQMAQMQLQEGALQKAQRLQDRKVASARQERENLLALNQLQKGLGDSIFTQQMQFQKDELNRAVFTERQLMDYKVMSAKRGEDLANYQQMVTQASQFRMQLLKTSYQRIQEQLQMNFTLNEQEKDQAQELQLLEAKRVIEEKIAKEQAEQANRGAMFSAIGTMGGIAAGVALTVATGGTGAVAIGAAAAAGGALGGAGGGALAANENKNRSMPSGGMSPSSGSGLGPTTYGR